MEQTITSLGHRQSFALRHVHDRCDFTHILYRNSDRSIHKWTDTTYTRTKATRCSALPQSDHFGPHVSKLSLQDIPCIHRCTHAYMQTHAHILAQIHEHYVFTDQLILFGKYSRYASIDICQSVHVRATLLTTFAENLVQYSNPKYDTLHDGTGCTRARSNTPWKSNLNSDDSEVWWMLDS